MDLMTAGTTYQQLKSKYQDFRAPTVRLVVDGTDPVSYTHLTLPTN